MVDGRWGLAAPLLLAAGCTGRAPPPTVAAPVPAPVVAVAALPPGASAGMLVPLPRADGSFPTPNQRLSAAGTLWHLRAALNVAALSCPDATGPTIRAGYNAWLLRDRAVLAAAADRYSVEYRGGGPTAFDDAMTRLYNFWSQTPVRPEFCAAATTATAAIAGADAAALPAVAVAQLAALDRPFIDFYRAYDAWRRATAAVPPARRAGLVLDLSTLPPDPESPPPRQRSLR